MITVLQKNTTYTRLGTSSLQNSPHFNLTQGAAQIDAPFRISSIKSSLAICFFFVLWLALYAWFYHFTGFVSASHRQRFCLLHLCTLHPQCLVQCLRHSKFNKCLLSCWITRLPSSLDHVAMPRHQCPPGGSSPIVQHTRKKTVYEELVL